MFRKIPATGGALPLFLAAVPVVWCVAYGSTMLVTGSSLGRQSSTAGLPAFFTFLASLPLALMGSVLGRCALLPWKKVSQVRLNRLAMWSAPFVLLLIALVACLQARGPILAAEREATPRVIVNTERMQRQTVSVPSAQLLRGMRIYDELGKTNQQIAWNGGSIRLANLGHALRLTFTQGGETLLIPLPGIDYINFVDALTLNTTTGDGPQLSLLITGRATGRRDLLAVISSSRQLVYLELLDRFWNFRTVSLASLPSPAGDVVLVGSEPDRLLAFAPATR